METTEMITEIATETTTETVIDSKFELTKIFEESINDMASSMISILMMFFTVAVIFTVVVEFGKKILRSIAESIRRL